ncbi:hypothetical protein [Micromonospora chersina]|uniref:hypothetical protein n=1 Tax=Micromonospora chersina TaxID=47854 RepID=UPI0036A8804D
MVAAKAQLLTRSEFGVRGSNTEPQQILRHLCQVVLDGRAGRGPQELPAGTTPKSRRFLRAEELTVSRLRELAQISDEQSVTHDSPEDLFAAAIREFRDRLDGLHTAAIDLNEVVGSVVRRGWPAWTTVSRSMYEPVRPTLDPPDGGAADPGHRGDSRASGRRTRRRGAAAVGHDAAADHQGQKACGLQHASITECAKPERLGGSDGWSN